MSRIVEVCEFHEGLRGGSYYFVVEGRRLVHISRYALSERRGYGTSYYIDLSKVRGKTIIEVFSSRSGPSSKVWAFPAEDLPLEWSARRRQDLPISFINDYELAHLKEGLSSYGVDVIDNVYLGGPGEHELVTYVKRAQASAGLCVVTS